MYLGVISQTGSARIWLTPVRKNVESFNVYRSCTLQNKPATGWCTPDCTPDCMLDHPAVDTSASSEAAAPVVAAGTQQLVGPSSWSVGPCGDPCTSWPSFVHTVPLPGGKTITHQKSKSWPFPPKLQAEHQEMSKLNAFKSATETFYRCEITKKEHWSSF